MLRHCFLLVVSLGFGACEHGGGNTIVVDGDVDHAAVHSFEKTTGRHPTREELLVLHRVWIDNEILHREGLKLATTSGDRASRERLIALALDRIDRQVRSSSVTDTDLRRWFEARRGTYDRPARIDFDEAPVLGTGSEAAVRSLVDGLNRVSGTPVANLRTFRGRPHTSIAPSFGPDVAAAFTTAPLGKWLALPSREGWRAFRVTAKTELVRPDFEALREKLRQDLIDATAAEKRNAAVRALWKNYEITFAEKHECAADQ
jgi:hypothetical protein